MSKPIKAARPYHALLNADGSVDVGDGDYSLQPGQILIGEFETKKERALYPVVAAWELAESVAAHESMVKSLKSSNAYAAKEQDAIRLQAHVVDGVLPAEFVYRAVDYPYLNIEVVRAGRTPLEAAQDIDAATRRDDMTDRGTWAQEDARVELREKTKAARQALEGN